ncbi:MAG: FkbM family methyltransferase [Pseudanabaena sp.]|nr:MAG: FkbM family methyltransferase [Pseudanabaena sp.]
MKSIIKSIKHIIKNLLHYIKEKLRSEGFKIDNYSLEAALSRSKWRNTDIRTVIDVGASDGRWSLVAKKYFPQAFYFLIEARQEHETALRQVKFNYQNLDYLISAAGDKVGQCYFDASDLFGGLASHNPFDQNCITVPITTIDIEVQARTLVPPFLIKLDTHGFEVPILEGAIQTLKHSELVIIEAYNFQLTNDSLKFYELCAYMETQGFRCVDFSEPVHRQKDKAFWQVDLFFIPTNNIVFDSNSYQ